MCLAVPGKIISITNEGTLERKGKVSFGGVMRDVNLAYVPEAQIGNYVVVHVGVAINILDESEAMKVFDYLKEINELNELENKEGGESHE
ncbi:MAG: HypC/HybG/HupF family hydrogenase formation chaperone [Candidatus Omnitrophica bacterium]|nr:HypC/HybG/HupF family hydrogenase formation chaperone [Candidatus Omnitrophota bacterium]